MLAPSGGSRPDLDAVLVRWITQEFVDDQHAQLDAIGVNAERRVHLARVFVDLAVGQDLGERQPPPDEIPSTPPEPGLLAELLLEQDVPQSATPDVRYDARRTLVIGGPGQGKTTLVQYLSQIHRAFILQHHRAELTPPQLEALDEILGRCERDRLRPRDQPRFPLFVVLRDFAAWLNSHTSILNRDLLLGFLSHQIRRSIDTTVDGVALAHFLTHKPWLLVLDGLDEVPGTGGRERALHAIHAFVEHIASPNDAIVATTRPQGYSGEFERYRPRSLAPLSLHRALWYAGELVRSWFPDERVPQQRLLDRMLQAAREEATARLMQSPLQVTIMAALLERVARAPHERWRLFKLYFTTIYDRELGRHSVAGELLRAQRPHIEAIHARAALHLQVACEAAGTTAALLSRDALLAIVHARLAEQYTDEARRNELAQAIVDVAENRLVFLVSPRDGFYGFELRSLQEFMASEAIMNGREHTVEGCIRRIARSTSWRNVLLFAISHCFANSHPLTEAFTVDLCEQLDTDVSDLSAVTLHLGARLALDILHEGSALYYPAIALRLLERALSSLPDIDESRMTDVLARLNAEPDLASGTATKLLDVLRPSVLDQDAPTYQGWVLLNAACAAGTPDADKLATEAWSAAPALRRRDILEWLSDWALSPSFARTVTSDLSALDPWDLLGQTFLSTPDAAGDDGTFRLETLGRVFGELHDVHGTDLLLHASIGFVDPDRSPAPLQVPDTPSWNAFARAVEFAEQPDTTTLARAISAIRNVGRNGRYFWGSTPWPLAYAIESADSPEDLERVATLAEQGHLGSLSDWLAMQEHWSSAGILRKDLELFATSGNLPNPDPVRVGLPFPSLQWFHLGANQPRAPIDSLYKRASTPRARRFFGSLLQVMPSNDLEIGVVREYLLESTENLPLGLLIRAFDDPIDESFVVEIDRHLRNPNTKIRTNRLDFDATERPADNLATRLRLAPSSSGLRRLLTYIVLRSGRSTPAIDAALATSPADDWAGRTTNLVWRLARTGLTPSDVLPWAEELAAQRDALNPISGDLEFALSRLQPEPLEALLAALLIRTQNRYDELSTLSSRLLFELRGLRRSGLHDPDIWRSLRLPDPPPAEDTPLEILDDDGDTGVYRLETLTLTNTRGFESFEFQAVPPANGSGQWIVLVGENGVGKTTLLRSLALALTPQANASNALAKLPARMRRSADVRATIEITGRGQRHSIAVTGDKDSELVDRGDGVPQRPFLLVAYGCRRGSAIGGPDRALLTDPIHDIHTLFDDTESGLNHAETWLQRLDHRALAEPGTGVPIRDKVKAVLCDLLPGVDAIHISPDEVCLEGPRIGHTRLAGLSDGYVTTLGWVCDLMARWLHKMELRERPVPDNFPEHMTGLVLIDEIDLHLHPRWQLCVIADVRRIFPRLSFVATTHNPLTLLGAREGELHVLRAGDRPGLVDALQFDVFPGLRADQVLTGVWFGLTSTVDPDTLDLLRRHRDGIRGGAHPGDPTVAALEAEIRKRLQLMGDTSLEDLVTREKTSPTKTPEQKAAIRKGVRDRFDSLIKRRT